jgi:pyrimidine-nucleoside phosphorylase
MVFGEHMLVLGGVATSASQARTLLEDALGSGRALRKLEQWIAAQGGDPAVVEDTSLLDVSPAVRPIQAVDDGFVTGFDTEGVGRAGMLLGAGRRSKDDEIDLGAGLVLNVRTGDAVHGGALLATMYAASEHLLDEAEGLLRSSIHLGTDRVEPPPLFHRL